MLVAMLVATRCRLLCAVLLVLLGQAGGEEPKGFPDPSDQSLFWGADQYDFSIVVPASGLECFWHFAHHGEQFYLTFMVQWVTGVGHDRHLSVTVNAPSSLIVGQADDAQGQISFAAEETGFYQMCFSNFHNRFGSMQVFLDFGVYYEGQSQKEEELKNKEELSRDINNTLTSIVGTSHRVENYVFHMFRHYNFGRMRRGADYYLLLSNNSYVSWWSAAQSVVIVLAGCLQLMFLKRLFHTKNPSETEKPRC